jgi:polyhydroxyalkanoate synthase
MTQKSQPEDPMNASTVQDEVSKWQDAMIEEGFTNLKRVAALPFAAQKAGQVRKGVTPSEVVYEEDKVRLFHYLSPEPPKYKTPLLFVFALVNRPYIFDLKEGRSVISHFVNAGFDTYLLDWGVPNQAERYLTPDDYINGYLLNAVDYLRERCDSPKVSMLGYCMGGTIATMFTALHQGLVKNLISLAAGIDFSTREGLINLWTDAKYFDIDKFVDTVGNVPAEFLQTAFLMLKPVQNFVEKPIGFWENCHKDGFMEDFFTMETWLNDNVAVPGEMYRQWGKYLFQQNLLVQNRMPVGKHIVDLRKITCPLMNLMAEKDDLVPCSQSAPLNDLVSSEDKQSIVVPAGHIGLSIGGYAQKKVWPEVCGWLGERS